MIASFLILLFYDPKSFKYPDLTGSRVERLFLVRFCVIDWGKTIIQHYIYFLTVGDLNDCVSMNGLDVLILLFAIM